MHGQGRHPFRVALRAGSQCHLRNWEGAGSSAEIQEGSQLIQEGYRIIQRGVSRVIAFGNSFRVQSEVRFVANNITHRTTLKTEVAAQQCDETRELLEEAGDLYKLNCGEDDTNDARI